MATHLLFDLDGTLTDSKLGITQTVQYALNQFGIQIRDLETLTPFIGPPLVESFMQFYDFSKKDALLAVKHYRDYYQEKGMYQSTPYPGIEDTLKTLTQNGHTLGIATAKPTFFAKPILQHFKLDSYFEHIAGASMDESRIHKADIIEYALNQFGNLPATQFIMIGDREHDMMGAKMHGLRAIGVLYGYGNKQELLEAGADHVIERHEELVEYL